VVLSDVYYSNLATRQRDDVFLSLSDIANVRFELPEKEDKGQDELRDAVAIVVGHIVQVNKAFLIETPNLKVVARFGVGYNNVNVDACTKKGIYVTYTPGALSGAVAELTMGLIICLSKGIIEADKYVRNSWAKGLIFPLQTDVENKVLGIIGMGQIGQAVARMAKAFGMDIVYFSRHRKPDVEKRLSAQFMELYKLLSTSDFVSLHIALSDSTRGLVGEKELRTMKNSAYLINTSRGSVVDEVALYKALTEGWIAGAGLDVFYEEPTPLDNPILKLPNVVLAPHMGSGTIETRRRMAKMNVDDIRMVLQGNPPTHPVTEQINKIFL